VDIDGKNTKIRNFFGNKLVKNTLWDERSSIALPEV
jgi:hypothetical protein